MSMLAAPPPQPSIIAFRKIRKFSLPLPSAASASARCAAVVGMYLRKRQAAALEYGTKELNFEEAPIEEPKKDEDSALSMSPQQQKGRARGRKAQKTKFSQSPLDAMSPTSSTVVSKLDDVEVSSDDDVEMEQPDTPQKKKANVPERVSFNSEEEKSTVVSAMEDELKTFQTEKARAFALLKSVLADEQRRRAAERAREAEEQLQQLQQQQLAAQQQAQQQALTQPAGTQPTQSKLDDKSKTVAVNMSTTGGLMHRALSAPDRLGSPNGGSGRAPFIAFAPFDSSASQRRPGPSSPSYSSSGFHQSSYSQPSYNTAPSYNNAGYRGEQSSRLIKYPAARRSRSPPPAGPGPRGGRPRSRSPPSNIRREPNRDFGRDAGRDVSRDQGRDLGRDPGRDLGRDPGRDPGRDLGRDPGREPNRDYRGPYYGAPASRGGMLYRR